MTNESDAAFTLESAPEGETPPAVEMFGVVLAYDGEVALEIPELALPTARITAVIGPNGSGKSTLLAGISGLLAPVRGTVRVFGGPPNASRVAHVLQETAANAAVPLTVGEVVRMGRYARRGPLGRLSDTDRDAVRTAMERLEIGDLDRRHLTELSGGQRQRVYVAQGLAQGADLLLLDEPATGLDLPTQQRIADALVDERRSERTVVYTTHDIAEAAEADFVVLLAGRVVAAGSPEAVLHHEHLSDAYGGHVHVTATGGVTLDDPHAHRPHEPRHG